MSRVPAHLTAIEDARLELASAAARTARRNQPKGMLLFSGAVLVGALIFLLTSVMSRQSALSRLEKSKQQAESAVQLAGRYKALRAASTASPTVQATGSQQIFSRLEQAGAEAKLERTVPLPKPPRTDKPPGFGSVQSKFDYTVTDKSLSAILRWLELSVAAVPGLEINSVSLKPDQHTWTIRVTFSRWEKLVEGS